MPLRLTTLVATAILAVPLGVPAADAPTAAGQATGAATDVHDGMPAGFTSDGDPYLGSPDAPITLEEWSDYLCPFSGRHFRQTLPGLIDKYIRPGKVRLVFRDFPLEGLHPTAARGHAAARCAGEQSPHAYWTMHDALFSRQDQWNRLADPGAYVVELVSKLGLSRVAYDRCIAGGGAAKRVQASVAAGKALEFSGTPQFRFLSPGIPAYPLSGAHPLARFTAVADAMLAGQTPAGEPEPPRAELPFWARAEGLAPDPKRSGYTVAGDPFHGDPQAKVVVVEFSDFQCAACAKHSIEAQPAIDMALVDTGKVRWVAKSLPLKAHPYAALAAVAAECAGEQGRYWGMRKRLFERATDWAREEAAVALVRIAVEQGLDRSSFQACFDGRPALERVLGDLYDAQGFVERTPSFVILAGGPTGSITGPLPADKFIKLLEVQLAAPQLSAGH